MGQSGVETCFNVASTYSMAKKRAKKQINEGRTVLGGIAIGWLTVMLLYYTNKELLKLVCFVGGWILSLNLAYKLQQYNNSKDKA